MDAMLKDLFGGDDDERRPEAQAQARDFVSRFDQGAIDEGYSDTEAWEQFQRVSDKVDPATIERAAEKAFAKMDPDQRAQVAQFLQQQGGQFAGGAAGSATPSDPRQMAGMVSRIQREAPGGLTGLLGGGAATSSSGGGGIGEAIGNLFGGGGNEQQPQATQEGGGFPGGTLGKVALGGIAAFALKEILGGRDDEEPHDTRAAQRPKRSV